MENNFKCNSCGKEFFVPRYTFKLILQSITYYYRGKRIECPSCNSVCIDKIVIPGDYSSTSLGTYTMKSIQERQEHLKKRSHDHFNKKIKDKKHQIDTNPNLQSLN